MALLNPKNLL